MATTSHTTSDTHQDIKACLSSFIMAASIQMSVTSGEQGNDERETKDPNAELNAFQKEVHLSHGDVALSQYAG